MTDRTLSAEKVKAWVSSNDSYTGYDWRFERDYVVINRDRFEEAIDSGQLDADRPECPKCGGTGETMVGEYARWTDRCDCKAGKSDEE